MTWCKHPAGSCEHDMLCDTLGACAWPEREKLRLQRERLAAAQDGPQKEAPADGAAVIDKYIGDLKGLDDAGWAAKEAEMAAERARSLSVEEEERRAALRLTLAEQGVPVKDLEACLAGGLTDTYALKVVTRWREVWRDKHSPILVLTGHVGVGKTTAAAWWICQPQEKHRYIRTRPLLFLPAARIARWPKYDSDAKAPMPPAVKDLFHAEALVVDDLGVEYDDKSGSFLSFFDELIDCRYAGRLPTIITSNVPPTSSDPKRPTLEKRYGRRFTDRVVIVGAEGDSLRKRGSDK